MYVCVCVPAPCLASLGTRVHLHVPSLFYHVRVWTAVTAPLHVSTCALSCSQLGYRTMWKVWRTGSRTTSLTRMSVRWIGITRCWAHWASTPLVNSAVLLNWRCGSIVKLEEVVSACFCVTRLFIACVMYSSVMYLFCAVFILDVLF